MACNFSGLDVLRVCLAGELHHPDGRVFESRHMASARHRNPDPPRQSGRQPVKLQRAEQADQRPWNFAGHCHQLHARSCRRLEAGTARAPHTPVGRRHACKHHARHIRIGQIARAQPGVLAHQLQCLLHAGDSGAHGGAMVASWRAAIVCFKHSSIANIRRISTQCSVASSGRLDQAMGDGHSFLRSAGVQSDWHIRLKQRIEVDSELSQSRHPRLSWQQTRLHDACRNKRCVAASYVARISLAVALARGLSASG